MSHLLNMCDDVLLKIMVYGAFRDIAANKMVNRRFNYLVVSNPGSWNKLEFDMLTIARTLNGDLYVALEYGKDSQISFLTRQSESGIEWIEQWHCGHDPTVSDEHAEQKVCKMCCNEAWLEGNPCLWRRNYDADMRLDAKNEMDALWNLFMFILPSVKCFGCSVLTDLSDEQWQCFLECLQNTSKIRTDPISMFTTSYSQHLNELCKVLKSRALCLDCVNFSDPALLELDTNNMEITFYGYNFQNNNVLTAFIEAWCRGERNITGFCIELCNGDQDRIVFEKYFEKFPTATVVDQGDDTVCVHFKRDIDKKKLEFTYVVEEKCFYLKEL